jgi:hypothetical protein
LFCSQSDWKKYCQKFWGWCNFLTLNFPTIINNKLPDFWGCSLFNQCNQHNKEQTDFQHRHFWSRLPWIFLRCKIDEKWFSIKFLCKCTVKSFHLSKTNTLLKFLPMQCQKYFRSLNWQVFVRCMARMFLPMHPTLHYKCADVCFDQCTNRCF